MTVLMIRIFLEPIKQICDSSCIWRTFQETTLASLQISKKRGWSMQQPLVAGLKHVYLCLNLSQRLSLTDSTKWQRHASFLRSTVSIRMFSWMSLWSSCDLMWVCCRVSNCVELICVYIFNCIDLYTFTGHLMVLLLLLHAQWLSFMTFKNHKMRNKPPDILLPLSLCMYVCNEYEWVVFRVYIYIYECIIFDRCIAVLGKVRKTKKWLRRALIGNLVSFL